MPYQCYCVQNSVHNASLPLHRGCVRAQHTGRACGRREARVLAQSADPEVGNLHEHMHRIKHPRRVRSSAHLGRDEGDLDAHLGGDKHVGTLDVAVDNRRRQAVQVVQPCSMHLRNA